MGILSRLAQGLADGLVVAKGFGGTTWDSAAGWRTYGGGNATRIVGSDLDWALEAGAPQLWINRVAGICTGYVFDKIIEPRVHVVYEDGEGMLQPIPKHPATELLLHPNPEYHGNALLQGLALSYKFAGNAYAMKVRGGTGMPVELYYIPHWLMWPIPPSDGGPTEFYGYRQPQLNGGFKTRLVPTANVIHIRDGIDPDNTRIGLCRHKAQYTSYASVNEIALTIAVVLRNRGNIGTLISPAVLPDGELIDIDSASFEDFKRNLSNNSTGDARGGIVASNYPIKVDRTTQSPTDLMLDRIGEGPTASICSTFGIKPGTVGLSNTGQGKGGEYGAKQKADDDASYRTCILPMLAAFAEAFTYQLLPDFPTSGNRSVEPRYRSIARRWVSKAQVNTADYRFNFDYSEVRELGEDADSLATRATELFDGNLLSMDEAREIIGMKPHPDPELGEKMSFQLLPAPGGDVGAVDPDNPENDPGAKPSGDPDDDEPEDDEGNEDD
jgi:hypothetical protein